MYGIIDFFECLANSVGPQPVAQPMMEMKRHPVYFIDTVVTSAFIAEVLPLDGPLLGPASLWLGPLVTYVAGGEGLS